MAERVGQIQARVANRQALGPRPLGSGGTPAPAAAAKSGTTGLGKAKIAPSPGKLGPGRPVSPIAKPVGAPAVPAVAPTLPWDAQYNLASSGAERNYGNKLAGLGAQRVIAQQNYGIDPGFNDYANNPYSRAALLRKAYEANSQGDTTSYAARGQLYAGSLVNAQAADQSDYNQGYNALNKEYLQNLSQIDQEKAQALEARENAINEAGWQRLEAAQNAPLEPAPGNPKAKNATPTGVKFPFYPTPASLPSNVNAKVKNKLAQAKKAK